MTEFDTLAVQKFALILCVAAALTACGSSNDVSFPLPDEPVDRTLYDLVDGPIDRASSLNLVSGRGSGFPTVLRVDASDQWDFSFGVIDSVPVWLPRGFFEGFEVSSGVLELSEAFEDVRSVPSDAELYEDEESIPIVVGSTYALRSRSDPSISISCRVYAKAEVVAVEGDPTRLVLRLLWNPNCNETGLAN